MPVTMNKYISVYCRIPRHYDDVLKTNSKETVDEALAKWKVTVSPEDIERIHEHSMNQVRLKVESLSRSMWSDDQGLVKMNIEGSVNGITSLNMPQDADAPAMKGWSVDMAPNGFRLTTDDDGDDTVPFSQFHQRLCEMIQQWYNTAVFYGVGSYVGVT